MVDATMPVFDLKPDADERLEEQCRRVLARPGARPTMLIPRRSAPLTPLSGVETKKRNAAEAAAAKKQA